MSNCINRTKRIVYVAIMVLITISLLTISANAQSTLRTGYSDGEYEYIITNTTSLYKYKIDCYSKGGTLYYLNAFASNEMYHDKGTTTDLSISYNNEISWSKTTSWNASVGADYGVSSVVSVTGEYGRGSTKGWTMKTGVANNVQTRIGKTYKSAFYAVAMGQHNYKCRWRKCSKANPDYEYDRGVYYMPYGTQAARVVRSFDEGITWQFLS